MRGETAGAACGAHAQNLQVGWREVSSHAAGGGGAGDEPAGFVEPVFLDCFLRVRHPGLPEAELYEGSSPRPPQLTACQPTQATPNPLRPGPEP